MKKSSLLILLVGAVILAFGATAPSGDDKRTPTLSDRVDKLEASVLVLKRRVIKLEHQVVKANATPVARKKKRPRPKPPVRQSQKQIGLSVGGNFHVSNSSIGPLLSGTRVLGEMTNKSGRSYKLVQFRIGLYDSSGRLVGHDTFAIENFIQSQTTSFQAYLSGVDPKQVSSFKIHYDSSF